MLLVKRAAALGFGVAAPLQLQLHIAGSKAATGAAAAIHTLSLLER
jgi:hypothetical protein